MSETEMIILIIWIIGCAIPLFLWIFHQESKKLEKDLKREIQYTPYLDIEPQYQLITIKKGNNTMTAIPTIQIKYHSTDIPEIAAAHRGEWYDLATAENYTLSVGNFKLINLGVSIKLPEGYEAILAPRSSTFKRYGILQTNSIGVIDNQYCGDGDIWMMPVYATREVTIPKGTKIAQFRIQHVQPNAVLEKAEFLDTENRGGFGSTGE